MGQREVDEALVASMDQARTLLDAESRFLRELNLGDLPLHERRMIAEVHQRVRASRDYAGAVIKRLVGRLDPYGDGYTFRPAEPIQITPAGIVPRTTGFSNYQDNVTVQRVEADVMTVVQNAAVSKMETQKPDDVATFFSDNRIRVHDGDAVAIRVQMMVRPLDPNNIATTAEVGLTTNGRTVIFPENVVLNGLDQLTPISYATTAYAAATWAANGAAVTLRVDGAVEVVSRTVFVTRLHRAR